MSKEIPRYVEYPQKGADFFRFFNSEWWKGLIGKVNRDWFVSLPSGGGSGKVTFSDDKAVIDLSLATFGDKWGLPAYPTTAGEYRLALTVPASGVAVLYWSETTECT